MRRLRIALTVVLILVWGAFVPLVMATDHCGMMGAMCEGPCGASCTVTAPDAPAFAGLVGLASLTPVPAVPASERPAPERPPKSPALSA
jgi:hypothetical protein